MPFAPGGDCPFASILSSRGKFYSHFGSHFVEFDPAKRAFTFLPRKTAAANGHEHDRGSPRSHLVGHVSAERAGQRSIQTGQFTDYGHLYKQNWAEYPRSVAADDQGWIIFRNR